jgi:hypothetical protein
MALNFGHKILLVFIGFGLLMGTLVYMSVNTEFQLVSKDYYKEELEYQEIIDARQNAAALSAAVQLSYVDKSLKIELPVETLAQFQQGEINFYCPAEARNDVTLALQPDSNGAQLIKVGESVNPAAYKVRIRWMAEGKEYYQETYMNLQ